MLKVQFAQEQLDLPLWKEIMPLLVANHEETGMPLTLCPNAEMYMALQEKQLLRFYAARAEGVLVGYNIFVVQYHLHYRDTLFAFQDTLFLTKKARGLTGLKFIKWVDSNLRASGVQVISRSSRVTHSIERLLQRLEYKAIEVGYVTSILDTHNRSANG